MFKSILPRITFQTVLRSNVYSTKKSEIGKVDFGFIKNFAEASQKLLIDVRTPVEIGETGKIPGSINIPMDQLCKSLGPTISSTEFNTQFGRVKPSTTTELIFTCRSGKRAHESAEKAIKLGYTNVSVYEGSWIDWQKHMNSSNCNK